MGLARPALTDLPIGRGATVDGSRAFQRPVKMRTIPFRRGATVECWGVITPCSAGFNCRSATNLRGDDANRGMNAPATIRRSLRDQDIELADLNQEAAEFAVTIQQKFEEMGI